MQQRNTDDCRKPYTRTGTKTTDWVRCDELPRRRHRMSYAGIEPVFPISQAPGRTATEVPIFNSLVSLDLEKIHGERRNGTKVCHSGGGRFTTRPTRQSSTAEVTQRQRSMTPLTIGRDVSFQGFKRKVTSRIVTLKITSRSLWLLLARAKQPHKLLQSCPLHTEARKQL